jgi:predicted O-methyltransferase YrrM
MNEIQLTFTNNWFDITAKPIWEQLIPPLDPRRILEIGSYEGRSACWLIETLAKPDAPLELHCIDTWGGGIEHGAGAAYEADMNAVEMRFNTNVKLLVDAKRQQGMTLTVAAHKSLSWRVLAKLLAEGREGTFDLVYVDGSHQAPDVLSDAVMAFPLLRVGGLLIFDDYLWSEHAPMQRDPLRCPLPAIDAFSNLYVRKLRRLNVPLNQACFEKLSN